MFQCSDGSWCAARVKPPCEKCGLVLNGRIGPLRNGRVQKAAAKRHDRAIRRVNAAISEMRSAAIRFMRHAETGELRACGDDSGSGPNSADAESQDGLGDRVNPLPRGLRRTRGTRKLRPSCVIPAYAGTQGGHSSTPWRHARLGSAILAPLRQEVRLVALHCDKRLSCVLASAMESPTAKQIAQARPCETCGLVNAAGRSLD